jgi:hypothetical protein
MPDLVALNMTGNPLIPPFDILLSKDNQVAPALKGALAKCFGGETPHLAEGSIVDKFLEADSQSTFWKNKAESLENQMKEFGSQLTRRESGLALSSDVVLELNPAALKVGREIGKGGFSIIH